MPIETPSGKGNPVPNWARDPFRNFAAEIRHLGQLLVVATKGISILRDTPPLVEALINLDDRTSAEERERLELAKKDADFAKREIETGFPLLHAWAVVGTWALFESTFRTFVAEWLKHRRAAWKVEQIQRLRIRLGEYEAIPKTLRHYFVVELLEKELGTGLKQGVNRFEAILEIFGLSGAVPNNLSSDIYEFSQVRNLVVHNASKVDRRFVESCPWFKAKVGESFFVTPAMFERYAYAVVVYGWLIIIRAGEKLGFDMAADRSSLLKDIEKHLSNVPNI